MKAKGGADVPNTDAENSSEPTTRRMFLKGAGVAVRRVREDNGRGVTVTRVAVDDEASSDGVRDLVGDEVRTVKDVGTLRSLDGRPTLGANVHGRAGGRRLSDDRRRDDPELSEVGSTQGESPPSARTGAPTRGPRFRFGFSAGSGWSTSRPAALPFWTQNVESHERHRWATLSSSPNTRANRPVTWQPQNWHSRSELPERVKFRFTRRHLRLTAPLYGVDPHLVTCSDNENRP